MIDGRVRFNVPPNTLYVISGTGFYGSNDPTNSVKALKEDVQGLGFNPNRSTPPCYNNTCTTHMQYDKITQKHKHKHK